MLNLLTRSVEYEVLHGMKFLLMSHGNKDLQCKSYPLASAMMMKYALTEDDIFNLTPKEDLMIFDHFDLSSVLREAKNLGKSSMNMNNKYNSNLKLTNYETINIDSLTDLNNALDKYGPLYSGIYDDGTFGGIGLVALYADGINDISHAVVITSVGKFKNVPGIYVELVNGWNNEYNCTGLMYVKIANNEESQFHNNLNLFGFNAYIEVKYDGTKYTLLFALTISFAICFGISLLIIIWVCTKRIRSNEDKNDSDKNVHV